MSYLCIVFINNNNNYYNYNYYYYYLHFIVKTHSAYCYSNDNSISTLVDLWNSE
jgi:hypothetical protein